MYEYKATVERWIDGDTVDVTIDLGFDTLRRERLRLEGINTPEIHSPDQLERERAIKAQLRASELCPNGSVIIVKTKKADTKEKYGRWLGEVYCLYAGNSESLADILIREGLGVAYDGGKR